MVKKYLCMAEGCDLLTEDVEVAMDHLDMGPEHEIVEVIMQDHKIHCKKLAERREELEMVVDEEME